MRRNHLTVERFPGVRFNQLQRSLVQLRVIISYQLSYTTYIYYIRHHLIIIIYNIIILKTIITTCKISCSPFAQTPATSPPSRSLLDKSTMHLGISSHHLHPNHPHHNLTIHKVSRCLARYSPRATTTNRPTNRTPKKPAWPGPN